MIKVSEICIPSVSNDRSWQQHTGPFQRTSLTPSHGEVFIRAGGDHDQSGCFRQRRPSTLLVGQSGREAPRHQNSPLQAKASEASLAQTSTESLTPAAPCVTQKVPRTVASQVGFTATVFKRTPPLTSSSRVGVFVPMPTNPVLVTLIRSANVDELSLV